MRRVGDLWPTIVSFDYLLAAYRKARRGKRARRNVAVFSLTLERELLALQSELTDGSYVPGPYRHFHIYERKPRLISAAPFRDRVVHHALMNVVEPLLDPRLSPDCYACRRNKGVHAAVNRYQSYARRYAYALKLDISAYFASIDHAMLNRAIAKYIKDPKVLDVFGRVIASQESSVPARLRADEDLIDAMAIATGIPIGNLTSQILANVYLTELDYLIRQQLGIKGYLRYVDDLILLSDDKAELWGALGAIGERLDDLRLAVHPRKAHVFSTALGVNVLGYRVFPGHRRLRRDNGYRYRRRLHSLSKAYSQGRCELSDVARSVAAWLGHVHHADAKHLVRAVLNATVFSRRSEVSELSGEQLHLDAGWDRAAG